MNYSTIAGILHIFFSFSAFFLCLILFIFFYHSLKPFRKKAIILAFISTGLYIIKFLPGIFNLSFFQENFNNNFHIKYFILLILSGPYDFFKIFIFVSVSLFLFNHINIKAFCMKENIKKIDYWIYIIISSILFIIITKLLISISFPHIMEKNRELYEIMLSVYQSPSIGSLHIAMCAPISEEVTYRLFWGCILLYTLNKYKWKWVMTGLITSLLWSFGHGGGIEPECMRFAQIFIYGIILSALFRKKGIEACIISHMISNIFITFIWK